MSILAHVISVSHNDDLFHEKKSNVDKLESVGDDTYDWLKVLTRVFISIYFSLLETFYVSHRQVKIIESAFIELTLQV